MIRTEITRALTVEERRAAPRGAAPGELPRALTAEERSIASGEIRPGATLGDYVVDGMMARGGCGTVYRATDPRRSRRVAIKVLHAKLAVLPKMVERFVREVEVLNLLRHPNIVEIHETGALPDGRPYYVMEYLEGKPLDAIVKERGRFSPEAALDVLEPVCEALEAAHAAGIIHRDVKANNICVVDGDPPVVKLLDFGIAKLTTPDGDATGLTTAGRRLGTPSIMAPEQLAGAPIDPRIDVYALGVLLYRLLTGRLPFDGRTLGELARQHLEDPAPRPSQRAPIAPALDAIVLRCMEKQPDRRFDSVRSFLEALRDAVGRAPPRAAPEPGPAPAIAVYVELRLSPDGDTFDEALGDDLGCALDIAEETLGREGFLIASATGNQILAVRPLGGDPAEARGRRRAALDVAASLHQALACRPTADDRVHANVCVHAGELLLRLRGDAAEGMEILGGPLACPQAWAPRGDVDEVFVTPAALEGLGAGLGPRPRLGGPASAPPPG
jgi:hypothetical protein